MSTLLYHLSIKDLFCPQPRQRTIIPIYSAHLYGHSHVQVNIKVRPQHSIIRISVINISNPTYLALNCILIKNSKCSLSKVRMTMLLHPFTDLVVRLVEKRRLEFRHGLAGAMGDRVQVGRLENAGSWPRSILIDQVKPPFICFVDELVQDLESNPIVRKERNAQ